jgi:hypothetical protein
MPVPAGVTLLDAAALPEAACTVWSNLVMTAHLGGGDVLLVHGGASGIGTHAIQVARALGATVAATAGSAAKLELCTDLGADIVISHRDEDFVERVLTATGGKGADVILDIMGASYLDRNLNALAPDGRLVIIGMQGGIKAELNIASLIGKRLKVIGTALRARPLDGPEGKRAIVEAVVASVWPIAATAPASTTRRIASSPPDRSGASVTIRMVPPPASRTRVSSAASGSRNNAGSWAPHRCSDSQGPSRWIPAISPARTCSARSRTCRSRSSGASETRDANNVVVPWRRCNATAVAVWSAPPEKLPPPPP